jgi:high-affinity iron transporter
MGNMLISAILALRESLEAALVVGILFSIIKRINLKGLNRTIWWGVGTSLLASIAAAVGLFAIGTSLTGDFEKIFEGFTLLIATGLLTVVIVWVNKTSRELQNSYETSLQQAASTNRKIPVFSLVFFSVLREGIELAIFLLAVSIGLNALSQITGVVIGVAIAVLLIVIWYRSVQKLPLGRFFLVTNILLIVFAAGLITRSVHEFIELGWLPALIAPLYNLNSIVNETSQVGAILRSLVGYTANPALTETFFYVVYLGLAIFFFVIKSGKPAHTETNQGRKN